ncbi:MAG: PilZ domain-containing protein [Sphingomonadales bacterium]
MASDFSASNNTDQIAPGFMDRGSERTPISTKSRLAQHNWYSVEVSLCDLSSTGFMAECDESVSIGSYVTLDLPGLGTVRAQVRWQVGGRMGGMFLDPIRLNQCEWVATPVTHMG